MRDNKVKCQHDKQNLVKTGDTKMCPSCLRKYPLIERGSRYAENNSRTNTTQTFA